MISRPELERRIAVGIFIVWSIVMSLLTPAIMEPALRVYEDWVSFLTGPSTAKLAELTIDGKLLDDPVCSSPVCAAPTVAFHGYHTKDFPGASEAAGLELSAEHERLLGMSALRVLPETAVDRECSVDRVPQTACVWMLLAGEAVPVQVSVVDLEGGNVGVQERAVFAGKGIAPQVWQRLSAVTRRAWLLQSGNGASILGNVDTKILVTPWRR